MTAPKILLEGKYIRFLNYNSWEYVQRKNCTGIVIILALTREKKILFTEQYRVPVGKHVIEFPAGLVNDLGAQEEETLEKAALRELLEETGYQAKRMIPLVTGPMNSGLSSDLVSFFRAVGLVKKHDGGGDETECITVHEVPLQRAETWLRTMEKRGKLVDPKAYAGLYFLNQRGKKRVN